MVHDLEVFWTGNRGFGLRTNTPIKAGDFVMQYVGEIITINESYRRTIEEYKGGFMSRQSDHDLTSAEQLYRVSSRPTRLLLP